MPKIIISRGMHPNETTAFSLAEKVYDRIKNETKVKILTVPYELTFLGFLQSHDNLDNLTEKEIINEQLKAHTWIVETASKYGRDTPIVDFHNYDLYALGKFGVPVEEMRLSFVSMLQENFLKNMNSHIFLIYGSFTPEPYFVFEIPAIFKPISSRIAKNLDGKLRKNMFFREKDLYFAHEYNAVDARISKLKGLTNETIIDKLTNGIKKYILGEL